jgi:hypothetical protein
MAEKIIDNKSQSPTNPRGLRLSHNYLIAAVLILILIIGGIVFWQNGHSNQAKFSYQYKKSTNFALTSKGSGFGILIKRPDQINIPSSKVENSNSSVLFEQTKILKKDGKDYTYLMATFALKSRPYPKPILGTTNYRDTISKTLNDPSNGHYNDTVANTQAFAKQINPYTAAFAQEIKLGPAKSFSSSNIKKYAWQFDVTMDHLGDEPAQQGRVIYVLGDHAWYYIMVTAETKNWQNNQKFFQDILNSASVDK